MGRRKGVWGEDQVGWGNGSVTSPLLQASTVISVDDDRGGRCWLSARQLRCPHSYALRNVMSWMMVLAFGAAGLHEHVRWTAQVGRTLRLEGWSSQLTDPAPAVTQLDETAVGAKAQKTTQTEDSIRVMSSASPLTSRRRGFIISAPPPHTHTPCLA